MVITRDSSKLSAVGIRAEDLNQPQKDLALPGTILCHMMCTFRMDDNNQSTSLSFNQYSLNIIFWEKISLGSPFFIGASKIQVDIFKIFFNFLHCIFFIVVQVQLSQFSRQHHHTPHPSLPPTLKPTPFGFVHVSFVHVL